MLLVLLFSHSRKQPRNCSNGTLKPLCVKSSPEIVWFETALSRWAILQSFRTANPQKLICRTETGLETFNPNIFLELAR